jgi:uncharacterized membrane protein
MDKVGKGKRYFKLMSEWQEAANSMSSGFLIMGRVLSVIKKEQLWRLDNISLTFRQWVENELKICYSQAMRLIQVYNDAGKWLEKPEFKGIDIYKVVLLLPHMKNKSEKEIEDLFHQAKTLKVNDIRNNLREAKGLVTTDNCDHEDTELWNRCKKCNKWFK